MYVVDADVARLTGELRAAFPEIRFVEYEYWRAQTPGATATTDASIPYCPALTGTGEYCHLRVWLEPERWEAEWDPPNENGYRFLMNEPKQIFVWYPPRLREGSWDRDTGRNTLEHADICFMHRLGDEAQLRLMKQAWRLLDKIAVSNVPLCWNVLEMEAVLGPEHGDDMWIGHEALKWLHEDPQRVIWKRHRPCDAINRTPGWWN